MSKNKCQFYSKSQICMTIIKKKSQNFQIYIRCKILDHACTELNTTSTDVLPKCAVVAWIVVDGWLVVWCVVESVFKWPELWINPL